MNTARVNAADGNFYLRKYAELLDSKFRIPGTSIRFGLDPIIGLVPILGDFIGYGFSIVLLFSAFKKGVRGEVFVKILFNMILDAVFGMIPVLGNLFDFAYKANDRNFKLLTEYVELSRHSGSAWPYVISGFLALSVIIVCAAWVMFSLLSWLCAIAF